MAYVLQQNKWVHSGSKITSLESLYIGRPTYVYDLSQIQTRFQIYQKAIGEKSLICYAVKANAHAEILKLLHKLGSGFDVVSTGELKHCLNLGIEPQKIVFSGVGKTIDEITFALKAKILQLNIESEAELNRVIKIAKQLNVVAPIGLRINPDVDVITHPYIRTGFRENKFGIDEGALPHLIQLLITESSIQLNGITLHIGSQIQSHEPFIQAIKKGLQWMNDFANAGFNPLTFDIGGGLGIDYSSPDESFELERLKKFGHELALLTKNINFRILTEPGRFLVARAGILLTEVQYVKKTPFKKFIIVNTGMHHLMRPALYQAHHRIEAANNLNDKFEIYDVVGPICESSDVLGRDRKFSNVKEGDILIIFDVGAYGMSMANAYNMHEFPVEISI